MQIEEMRRAQSDLRLVVGIAIGIQAAQESALIDGASLFENAIATLEECDDEFLIEMTKKLQEILNDRFEALRSKSSDLTKG